MGARGFIVTLRVRLENTTAIVVIVGSVERCSSRRVPPALPALGGVDHRLAAAEGLPDALVEVSDGSDTFLFAVFVLEDRFVDLELLQEVQIGSWFGHVPLNDGFDALFFEGVRLIVVGVLIGDPIQDLVDQGRGVDQQLGVGRIEILQQLHDVVPGQQPLGAIHRVDRLHQQHAIGIGVLGEHQQQFQGRLHHQSELGGDEGVQPLHGLVVLDDAVHPVDVEHHLAERPQDVVLVVLVGLGADFDQARQAVVLDELVDEVLVLLEDLLEGEEGAAQLPPFGFQELLWKEFRQVGCMNLIDRLVTRNFNKNVTFANEFYLIYLD